MSAKCQLQHPRRGQLCSVCSFLDLQSKNSPSASDVHTWSLTLCAPYKPGRSVKGRSSDGESRDRLCAQYVPGAFTGKEAGCARLN